MGKQLLGPLHAIYYGRKVFPENFRPWENCVILLPRVIPPQWLHERPGASNFQADIGAAAPTRADFNAPAVRLAKLVNDGEAQPAASCGGTA